MIVHWREFLGVVAVITVVPGPDTALVIRNSVRRGRAEGLLTAVGCTLGLTVWALAASVGLATLLSLSASLFGVVRIAGAVYLTVLGAQLLRHAWRTATAGGGTDVASVASGGEGDAQSGGASRARTAHGAALLEGLFADLLNPKAAVFFTALLPQFVAPGDAVVSAIVLGLMAAVAALGGFSAYALLAARGGSVLRRRWPAAVLDAVTGVVLLVFGVALVRRGPAFVRAPVGAMAR